MNIHDLLQETINRRASDLHLVPDYPPMFRVDTQLASTSRDKLTAQQIEAVVSPLLDLEQRKILESNKSVDIAYSYGPGRFRINLYYSKGNLCAEFRLIPIKVQSIDDLDLPQIFHQLSVIKQGFVLVTGPTGHGKTTSLAAVIEEINRTREAHVVTLEDPIEYVFQPSRALISQREFGTDFHSWEDALRGTLREDPDVVLIGEMRDFESISSALTIAETGHLVLATLHTNSAAQTVDRIVDVFPQFQQAQIRLQLSNVLEMVISQRLLPRVGGGMVPVQEIMTGTPAVRSTIREGKTHQLDNIIQTSAEAGMQTLEMGLANLIRSGKITVETAQAYTLRPEELVKLVGSKHGT